MIIFPDINSAQLLAYLFMISDIKEKALLIAYLKDSKGV